MEFDPIVYPGRRGMKTAGVLALNPSFWGNLNFNFCPTKEKNKVKKETKTLLPES